VPEGAGGALDLHVSFDLDAQPKSEPVSKFGVAVRAARNSTVGAAQNVWFEVSAADPSSGIRNVTVGGFMNGPEYPVPKPYPCHRNVCPSNVTQLFPGETLDVRILVDRPVVEVFVLGGRIAFVHQDLGYSQSMTAVHVYNEGARAVKATNVSAHGMSCGWLTDMPVPKGQAHVAAV
jgi:hypothetical protein